MIKCPCCNGEGGYTEPVIDYGQGPYYPCEYCDDNCKVSFWKWLDWKTCFIIHDFFKFKD